MWVTPRSLLSTFRISSLLDFRHDKMMDIVTTEKSWIYEGNDFAISILNNFWHDEKYDVSKRIIHHLIVFWNFMNKE